MKRTAPFRRLMHRLFNGQHRARAPHGNTCTVADMLRFQRAVICHVAGGLANQMIAYKFGRYLSEVYGRTLILDVSAYEGEAGAGNRNLQLTNFNIRYDILISSSALIQEIISSHDTTMLYGEAYKDFSSRESIERCQQQVQQDSEVIVSNIFSALTMREAVDSFAAEYGVLKELSLDRQQHYSDADWRTQKLIDATQNSVAIHVRRGDFATHDGNILLTEDYFNNSMDRMRNELASPRFFVFSDDISWCRRNLKSLNDTEFVDFNDERSGYKDLSLASSCRHFILSNLSTYSHQILELSRSHPGRIVIRSTADDLARNH